MHTRISALISISLAMICSCYTSAAMAWGDEGHQAVALIARHFLNDSTKAKVDAILAADTEPLQMNNKTMTNASFDTQATWPDYYRTSTGRTGPAYQKTHNWHFADIEIHGGSLDQACNSFPALPANTTAFDGPASDCVVNKIYQFTEELRQPTTTPIEKLRALKFLMHFVGDLHQPLHASDDKDQGGNGKNVTAKGIKAGKLHHYWDTEFVLMIGATPQEVADALIPGITNDQVQQWAAADPKAWAAESYDIAKAVVYGELPKATPARTGGGVSYKLTAKYVADAQAKVREQLAKAGVRLATTLNAVLP